MLAAIESKLRHAGAADIPEIVDIHLAAFQNSFLTRLGRAFLVRYYECVLNYDGGILLISKGKSAEGFAAGFMHPESFYRGMKKSAWSFAVPAAAAVIRDPSLALRVLHGFRRVRMPAQEKPAGDCELSSIAVRPEATGRRIGAALVHAFLEQAWTKNARCVSLTTDADGNDLVNKFYARLGFDHRRTFERYRGRPMNEYVFYRPGSGR